MRRYWSAVVITSFLFVVSATAQEHNEALDREATTLYQQVMSPFCPGRSLNDCPSSKAHELKEEIKRDLAAGQNPEQILEGVFQRFGDQYRALPPRSGFGGLAWAAPVCFLLLGLALWMGLVFKRVIKRRRGPHPGSAPIGMKLNAQDEAQLAAELKRLDTEESF